MDNAFDNIPDIIIDSDSRLRWKSLRKYLNEFIKIADTNSDRLAALKEELSSLREKNLKLTEAIQDLSELAHQECLREESLTLNDDDYDIVVDVQDEVVESPEPGSEASYTIGEFLKIVGQVPGIGPKKQEAIAAYFEEYEHSAQSVLDFGTEAGDTRG